MFCKLKKLTTICLISAAMALPMTAHADTITITDTRNRTVEIPKNPQRILLGFYFEDFFAVGGPHAYIRRGTQQLNGKVERSHRSDEQEFYQLLSFKGDVDLEAKLDEWELFYNFGRPHGAFNGKTPYEALREKLT